MSSEVSMPGAEHDREPTVEELKRVLAEEREEQAASAEILRVISRSPMDLQRVFAEIAATAARLCDAYDATIFQAGGGVLRIVAGHGPIPSLPVGDGTIPLLRGVVAGRAVLDGRTIHVTDLQAETAEYPAGSDLARRFGHRTIVAVPLMRSGEAIGAIAVRRTEVRPFTGRHRHRERAPVRGRAGEQARAARVIGISDCDGRGAGRH